MSRERRAASLYMQQAFIEPLRQHPQTQVGHKRGGELVPPMGSELSATALFALARSGSRLVARICRLGIVSANSAAASMTGSQQSSRISVCLSP
jgi:hypothetical protein